MKASDYIVEFLIEKGISDVFGYPGGMVTHLMDSFYKYSGNISAHLTYHEQSAAFAACGYAQTSGKPGVAYATSGPGATNLITGICNAYFDSIPVLFITGQVNGNESKAEMKVRQRGFQETDIVSMVKPVTKYAVYVNSVEDLPGELEKAYQMCISGRGGPVLLDIPMNVFRGETNASVLSNNKSEIIKKQDLSSAVKILKDSLSESSSPVFLVGGGIKTSGCGERIRRTIQKLQIPTVSSMIAFDVMQGDPLFYGFIGAYGKRAANFIAAKSDLIISIGSRMDIRQVGIFRERFAPNAKIIRFDVDPGELEYKIHNDETQICLEMDAVAEVLESVLPEHRFSRWISVCDEILSLLSDIDDNYANRIVKEVCERIPDEAVITTDVGQNQVWVAQSLTLKGHQKVLFSGGHGAMGFSLPAAIGAYYGSGKKPVICITGDGGMQMNIQELQFVARERLPIKIVVLNNSSLGMIRHFQEMYFEGRYFQTKAECGYTAPDFSKIASAYDIKACRVHEDNIESLDFNTKEAELFEVILNEDTYVIPKLEFGMPNHDQEPRIDRALYDRIMHLHPQI